MSTNPLVADSGDEREMDIDLRRWLDALRARWWIAVAGLVIGIVIGVVYSMSGGGQSWVATATIARGQAFSPNGNSTVQNYITAPKQIENIVSSPAVLDRVGAQIGMRGTALVGHITASTITSAGTPSPTNTGSTIILVTATLPKARKAEEAANAMANEIKRQTTTRYVLQSIKGYQTRLSNYAARVVALRAQIASLSKVLAHPTHLSALDQLVLTTQLQGAQAALGSTLDSQTLTQQQLILAQDVETTQIIPPPAKAMKTVARSRRNAVVFGGLIGLIIGTIIALVLGLRSTRTPVAA
jgi:capsular polysaccharide biosynthesis protein